MMNDDGLFEDILDVLLELPADARELALSSIERTAYGNHPLVRALRDNLADGDGLARRLRELSSLPVRRPADSAPDVPDVIGRYHVVKRLGQGGMGEVFLAEQRAPLRRLVAVKLVKAGLDTNAVIARFEQERQTLARMDHRNICRVLDAGRTPLGRPFFVMEYIPGIPLTQFADEQKLGITDRLRLFLQACEGVAHAHTKGVLHRDLKPTNLLAWVDAETGLQELRVIDFGIAKALSPSTSAGETQASRASVGTPAYMSPEQSEDSLANADTRTDVYSLGVVLFELLAGPRPQSPVSPSTGIDSLSPADAASLAESRGRLTPASLVRALRSELEWIPMKATRPERERRYESVLALAADVRRYLAGEPLLAGPESKLYRGRKFLARHAALFSGIAALLVVLLAAVATTSVSLARQTRARRAAEDAAVATRQALYVANLSVASDAINSGDGLRAREALDAVPKASRGWEWRWLDRQSRVPLVRLRLAPGELARSTMPVNNRLAFSKARSGDLWLLWEVASGTVVRRERAVSLSVVPGGDAYARLNTDGSVTLVGTQRGDARWTLPPRRAGHPWQMTNYSVLLDGSCLLVWDGSSDEFGRVEIATGRLELVRCREALSVPPQVYSGAGRSARGTVLDVHPDGSRIEVDPMTGTWEHGFQDWDSNERQLFSPEFTERVQKFAPNSRQVLLPGRQWCAKVMFKPAIAILDSGPTPSLQAAHRPSDISGRLVDQIPLPATADYVEVTPDESVLLVTLLDGNVVSVPVDVRREPVIAAPGSIGLSRSPRGDRLLSLNWGDVTCFDGTTGLPLWGRNLGPGQNLRAAWDERGHRVAVASEWSGEQGSDVFVLDDRTGEQLAAWSEYPVRTDPAHAFPAPWAGDVAGMAFTPDGRELWVGRSDGSTSRVDSTTWAELARTAPARLPLPGGDWAVAPDGRTAARFAFDPVAPAEARSPVELLELSATHGTPIRVEHPGVMPSMVAWTDDGARFAVAWFNAGSAWIEICDRAGRMICSIPPTGGGRFYSLAFTPSGDRLLAGREDGNLVVLDPTTGARLLSTNRYSFPRSLCTDLSGGVVLVNQLQQMVYLDADDVPGDRFAEAIKRWPKEAPVPANGNDARRWISTASAAVLQDEKSEVGRSSFLALDPVLTPAQRSLGLAIDARVPQSINRLFSAAQSIKGARSQLPTAIAMLREVARQRPESSTVQRLLGELLFSCDRLAESIDCLERADGLRKAGNLPGAASDRLRLAIAKHRLRVEDDRTFAAALATDLAAGHLVTEADTPELMQIARREGVLPK